MRVLIVSLFLFPALLFSQSVTYPVSKKINVTDDYYGVQILEPYRWLEDDRSDITMEWVKAQNVVTSEYLKQMPARAAIKTRLTELWNYDKESAPYKKGNYFFCYRNNGLQNQSVLYVKKTLSDPGTILLDPNTLSADGTIALNSTSVSNDGKTLAYGLSMAGSDWVEIRFRDIVTKKDLPDVIKWVKFSGISWKGNGVYYSRYDKPSGSGLTMKNQFHKLFYHTVGTTQDKDLLVLEDMKNPDHNFGATVTDDEKYLLVFTSESTSGEKLMVKDLEANGPFITISDNFDYEYSVIDNVGSTFYMVTNNKAPRYRLVSFSLEDPLNWKTILPESNSLLEGARLCNQTNIIANYLEDVSSKLYCYNLEGKLLKKIELPGICRINAFNTDKKYDFATYSFVQFTAPEQTWYLDARTWQSKPLFKPRCSFQSANYVTEQVFYTSKKDGTSIPMFITHRKGLKPTPETPCFVYGYGGFNISIAPEFRIDRTVFLEAGGIYCVPNIRGGGEYGEDWHKEGTKCKKQNVFDDFISACEFLVEKKYTSFNKIAIHGRSNGGLLVGAVMTQRPDICKVAIPAVGVLDMLRFHKFTIGRAWSVDYGNSDNREEFFCLLKYSPLHNLRETNYPATLILTGDHDDRVVPAHSFKFAATLQDKNRSPEPTLIRIDVNAGHGAGKPTSKQIDEFTDMWAFVFKHLGMKSPQFKKQ